MKNSKINCNDIVFSNDVEFCLISGPCQIESENHALDIAGKLKEITIKNIPRVSWSSEKPLNLKPRISTFFFLCFGEYNKNVGFIIVAIIDNTK